MPYGQGDRRKCGEICNYLHIEYFTNSLHFWSHHIELLKVKIGKRPNQTPAYSIHRDYYSLILIMICNIIAFIPGLSRPYGKHPPFALFLLYPMSRAPNAVKEDREIRAKQTK